MLAKLSGPELRKLLDSIGAPSFILEVHQSGTFTFLEANSVFEEAFVLNRQDYLGHTLQQVYSDERGARIEQLLNQCVEEETTVEAVERLALARSAGWWRFSFRPIRNVQGDAVRIFGAATNVSRQVELEKALKYEHLLLSVQSEMMPDGVLVVSKDGDYLSWNEKFKALLGLSESDMQAGGAVVDRKLAGLVADPKRFQERVEAIIAGQSADMEEDEVELMDGRTLVFFSRGLVDHEDFSYGRVWFVRDISAARRAEQEIKSAHAAEEAQNLLLTTVLDLSPDGILVGTADGEVLSWNQRFKELWGISDDQLARGRRVALPIALAQMVEPDRFLEAMRQLYADSSKAVDGQELLLKDGRTLVWHSRGMVSLGGDVRGRAWFYRDDTERRRMLRDLLEARAWERGVLESTSQAIITTDNNRMVRIFNPAAERLLGYAAHEVVGKVDPIAFHDMEEVEKRRAQAETALSRPIGLDELFTLDSVPGSLAVKEWTYIAKDGRRIPIELSLSRLLDAEGRLLGSVGVASDISERKEYEKKLQEMAWTDPLTGVWNRRRFHDVANKQIHVARRRKEPVAFMLIDIDHFKRINDTYGHDAGDAVLKCVAQSLSRSVRAGDVYCRWGGEEFAVLVVNVPGESAYAVAQRVHSGLKSIRIDHSGTVISVTASIGLSEIHDASLEEAIKRADEALYRAKKAGRDRVVVG